MENFTPIASTVGGALIGLSAAMLMLTLGRVAGISGIFAGILVPSEKDIDWRVSFMVGLIGAGIVYSLIAPGAFANTTGVGLPLIVFAGLLVGFGTQMGSGCTSGHGVCGIPRLSIRSIAAVGTFMGTGAVTVFVVNLMNGGAA